MKATAAYQVEFRPETTTTPEPAGRVPRVARLLALAHRIDAMIEADELRDLAHAAEVCGLTRARVTQVMNLMLLSPAIQEAIIDLPPVITGRDPVTERQLRAIVADGLWNHEVDAWQRILSSQTPLRAGVTRRPTANDLP